MAGIGQAPADAPFANLWPTYLEADDVDKATATAVGAGAPGTTGGTLLREPQDSPYRRVASVADPLGAAFQLITPPAREP